MVKRKYYAGRNRFSMQESYSSHTWEFYVFLSCETRDKWVSEHMFENRRLVSSAVTKHSVLMHYGTETSKNIWMDADSSISLNDALANGKEVCRVCSTKRPDRPYCISR